MTNLLDLPPELIKRICEELCYHCRNPKHFVNHDEDDTKNDKRSLAKVCLTSRALRNLVQPILYHYYATGNGHWVHHNGIDEYTNVQVQMEHDRLPLFLRTIIERPDLGRMIRGLQLCHNTNIQTFTPELYVLFHRHASQMGGPFTYHDPCQCSSTQGWNWNPQAMAATMATGTKIATATGTGTGTGMTPATAKTAATMKDADYRICSYNRDRLRRWMMMIAIVKTAASLESLLIAPMGRGRQFPLLSSFASELLLPSLKRMLLKGDVQYGSNAKELLDLQTFASGIEELNVDFEARNSFARWSLSVNWKPMNNLRTLFCINFNPEVLKGFLSNCPALEDLECYVVDKYGLEDWAPSEYSAAFRQTKRTLRRLRFAWIPRTGDDELHDILEDDQYYSVLQARHTHGPLASFNDFTVLQDLTLDQQSFYRPSQTSSSIIWFLPPNIKHFQILYAFFNMGDNLTSLAHSVKHGSFPSLHTVTLSVFHRVGYDRTHTWDWIEESRADFENVRVQFIHEVRRGWHESDESLKGSGRDTRGCEPLTIIPGATAGSRYVACEWSESWKWCEHAEWAEPTGWPIDAEHYDCEFHLLQTGESWSVCDCCDDIAVVDDSE
ncbi:hypothetical protein GCG54_00010224 [Colletotrichum gloeosporioides]|uniref:Uncharacterized protein n=1 Tax=Colletotrichum gloeosporioides TaxID=474922 RepID=A0A8H4CBN2_COLGL|nr:uncharacterized protein GCG54_00010224 [Colletotrichum gloeosporioides]KAF3800950.1 hypothetical protein GCG54_00010224 [Colletotrichum gloeosporioides]